MFAAALWDWSKDKPTGIFVKAHRPVVGKPLLRIVYSHVFPRVPWMPVVGSSSVVEQPVHSCEESEGMFSETTRSDPILYPPLEVNSCLCVGCQTVGKKMRHKQPMSMRKTLDFVFSTFESGAAAAHASNFAAVDHTRFPQTGKFRVAHLHFPTLEKKYR